MNADQAIDAAWKDFLKRERLDGHDYTLHEFSKYGIGRKNLLWIFVRAKRYFLGKK